MTAIEFTAEELIQAATVALGSELIEGAEKDTITAPELSTYLEISRERARIVLRQLVTDGVAEKAWVGRYDGWGPGKVRGYRYVGNNHD